MRIAADVLCTADNTHLLKEWLAIMLSIVLGCQRLQTQGTSKQE
jgi:hypothetical protein